MKLKKAKGRNLNPKPFLERYGDKMTQMSVGKVLYVTHFGARTRIQKTETGYIIEPWRND